MAACLVGGLLGFAVVSLSWLGRGSTVPLQGLSGLTPADADTAELSSTFFVLLMPTLKVEIPKAHVRGSK